MKKIFLTFIFCFLLFPLASEATEIIACEEIKPGNFVKVSGKPAIFRINEDNTLSHFTRGDIFKTWTLDNKYAGNYKKITEKCILSFPYSTNKAVLPFPGSVIIKIESEGGFYEILGVNEIKKIDYKNLPVLNMGVFEFLEYSIYKIDDGNNSHEESILPESEEENTTTTPQNTNTTSSGSNSGGGGGGESTPTPAPPTPEPTAETTPDPEPEPTPEPELSENELALQELKASFTTLAKEEADWIINNCQLENGAISWSINKKHLVPYSAHLALDGVAEAGAEYAPNIKKYIEWYLANYNTSTDMFGATGTIYDFIFEDGVQTSQNDYDSSDAYAGTFLMLLNSYYEISGDTEFINNNLDHFEVIAGAIEETEQENHLTWATPDYHTAYTMDNTEVWRGLEDFASLLRSLGNEKADLYQQKADDSRNSIENLLWNEEGPEYFTYWNDDGLTWSRFYPDGTATLWPFIFDIPETQGREVAMYERFMSYHPNWITLEADDFPWVPVALMALRAGEYKDVLDYVENARAKYPDRRWTWYSGQSGWMIKLMKEIESL